MVIARDEWFKGKEGSYLERYKITWQGIVYLVIMLGFPIILLMMFSPEIIITGYYQNSANIAIIALAWFIFTFTDLFNIDLKDMPIKPSNEKEDNFRTALRIGRNAGWSITSILIIGASISYIYNIHSLNFYLGLFATAAFVTCIVMAITKYKLKKSIEMETSTK